MPKTQKNLPALSPQDVRALLQDRAAVLQAPPEVVASCSPSWPGQHVSLGDVLGPSLQRAAASEPLARLPVGLAALVGVADDRRVSADRSVRKRRLREAAAVRASQDAAALEQSLSALAGQPTAQQMQAACALLDEANTRSLAMQRAFARFTRQDLLPQALAILQQADGIGGFCDLAQPQDVSKLLNYCIDPATFTGHRAKRQAPDRLLKDTHDTTQIEPVARLLRHGASLQVPDLLGQVPQDTLFARCARALDAGELDLAEALLALPLDWSPWCVPHYLLWRTCVQLAQHPEPQVRFARLSQQLAQLLHRRIGSEYFEMPPADFLWDIPDAAGVSLFAKLAPRLRTALQEERWPALGRLRRCDLGGREHAIVQAKLVELIEARRWDAVAQLRAAGWCTQLDTSSQAGMAALQTWRWAAFHAAEVRDMAAWHRLASLEAMMEGPRPAWV